MIKTYKYKEHSSILVRSKIIQSIKKKTQAKSDFIVLCKR